MRGNFYKRPKRKVSNIVTTERQLRNLRDEMNAVSEFAVDTETNTLRVNGPNKDFRLVGISISWGDYNNYYIPIGHRREEDINNNADLDTVVKYLKPIFAREDVRIIGCNYKFDRHALERVGIPTATRDIFDNVIASWLCDENKEKGLKQNAERRLGVKMTEFKDVIKVPKKVKKEFGLKANSRVPFDLVLIEDGAPYALDDAYYTWYLYLGYRNELEDEGMYTIYKKMYLTFMDCIFHMEERGVKVDREKLDWMREEINKDCDDLTYKMFELVGAEFNPNSNLQMAELMFGYVKPDKMNEKTGKMTVAKPNHYLIEKSFGFKPITKTPTGMPQTNNSVFNKILKEYAKNPPKNARKKEGLEFCEHYLYYSRLQKIRSAFIEGSLEQMYDDGKVHPSFNISGTDSGRVSCISAGTLIEVIGGRKPIQDITNKDLVYCYDDEGNIKISRVVRLIDQGYKPCVEVHWQSQGTHKYGSLVCTPDHLIRTREGEWVQAQDLAPKDRVTHLRRSTEKRPRIYGADNQVFREQELIKIEYFKADAKMHIHHKDFDPTNNKDIDNFVIMTPHDHISLHSKKLLAEGKLKYEHLYDGTFERPEPKKGKDHPMYLHLSKDELESMVNEYKGRIRDIPIDFDTFKKKCDEVGYDYRVTASKYQKKYKDVTDEEFIESFMRNKGVKVRVQKDLGIGRYKCEDMIARLDCCTNHKVVEVTDTYQSFHVYDLEIEDYHNFIASEICVHNCNSPNLMQLPSADDDFKYKIRDLYIPDSPNKSIISADFSNLEIRVLAQYSRDEKLVEMFNNGEDVHGSTAVTMFELDCDPSEVKYKYPHLRQASKILNFLLIYGGAAKTLYEALKNDAYAPIDLSEQSYLDEYNQTSGEGVAQCYIDKYFAGYSGVADFMKSQKRLAHQQGFVQTIIGRKRRLPMISSSNFGQVSYGERLSVNSPIQGGAADLMISAQNLIHNDERLKELDAEMLVQIHDEVLIQCPDENVDEVCEITQYRMENMLGERTNQLVIPFKADVGVGKSYQEAK